MAKVHFHYSTMNAGKSTSLLQSNHNYEVRDLKTYLFTPAVDAEVHDGKIHSRLGISKDAIVFDSAFNFIDYFSDKKDLNLSKALKILAYELSQNISKLQNTNDLLTKTNKEIEELAGGTLPRSVRKVPILFQTPLLDSEMIGADPVFINVQIPRNSTVREAMQTLHIAYMQQLRS